MLLTDLYHQIEQRLHGDEYADFGQYDRDRRRVRRCAICLLYQYKRENSDALRCAQRVPADVCWRMLTYADVCWRSVFLENADVY